MPDEIKKDEGSTYYPDAETKKIVEDMAAEKEAKEEKKEEAPKETPKETPAEEEKPKPSDKEEGDDIPEILPDEEEEGDEKELEKPARSEKFIPFQKHNKLRKENAELRKQLEDKKSTPEKSDVKLDKDFSKKLAEKYEGVNPEVVDEIRESILAQIPKQELPEELMKTVKDFQESQVEQAEKAKFDTELSKLVETNKDYSNVDKDKLYKLSRTKGNVLINGVKYPLSSLPLHNIIDAFKLSSPKKKSSESSRGGSKATKTNDYSDLSLAEIAKLPTKEFAVASEQRANKK